MLARGALLAVAGALALIAATPAPTPLDLKKVQQQLLPKKKLHSEFIVDVNKLGQVSRVRSMKSSGDSMFNAQTYGNAVQAFIRKPDGTVVLGEYRMVYDFNPATGNVRREALLVKHGGVDPNAKGLALEMEDIAHRHPATPIPITTEAPASHGEPRFTPNPNASVRVDSKRLPDLQQIIRSPSPH